MKKRELKQLAILGLTGGLLIANQAEAAKTETTKASSTSEDNYDPNDSNIGYKLMTEDELLIELNNDGVKMYNSLNPQGKALALEVASMRCAKTNPCGGLNACATDKNDCAGKGKCKGQGKCALSDKNLAVKLVYEKMAGKRSNAMNGQKK